MFFSNQKPGVQKIIYSYIATANDFKAVWQASKSSQRLIEQGLFDKSGREFYQVQCYVLSILIRAKTSLITDLELCHLAQLFLPKLANTALTLQEVLSGLELVAAIYQVPLEIKSITQQLDGKELLAWKCLAELAPALSPETAIPLFLLPIAKLDNRNDNKDLDERLTHLTTVVPKLEVATLVSLTKFILNKLVCSDNSLIRIASWKCLIAMVRRFDVATLVSLTEPILAKIGLEEENPSVCASALECLTAMVPKLDSEILVSLTKHILTMLNIYIIKKEIRYRNVIDTAIKCLVAVIPRLNDVEIFLSLINFLSTTLDDYLICYYVDPKEILNCLGAIAPRLETVTLTLWINSLLAKLNNVVEHSPVCEITLDVLALIVPELDNIASTILVDYAKAKIGNGDSSLCGKTLSCLTIIAIKLDAATLTQFIYPLLAKLENKDTFILKAAINCLKAVIPKLEAQTLALWTTSLLAKLKETDTFILRAGLDYLKVTLPRLEAATLAPWINILLTKLKNEDHDIREATLNILALIVPKLDNMTSTILVNYAKAQLDNSDSSFCETTLKYLTIIAPKLNAATLTQFINPLLAKLENKDTFILRAAINCLEAVLPKLEAQTLTLWINYLLAKLKDKDTSIHEATLDYLEAVLPRLETTILNKVINLLLADLERIIAEIEGGADDYGILQQISTCLQAIVIRLDAATLALWVDPLLSKLLANSDELIGEIVLECLTITALRLDTSTLVTLSDHLLTKLKHSNRYSEKPELHEAELSCLKAIIPKLDVATLPRFIDQLLRQASNSYAPKSLLNCLTTIVLRLDNEKFTTRINVILAKLTDTSFSNLNEALNCLSEIVFKLAQSNPRLSAGLIEQLVGRLQHSDARVAKTCLKLTIHLLIDFDKDSWTIIADYLLLTIKNKGSQANNETILLAQFIYPWLEKINQQVMANRDPAITDSDSRNTGCINHYVGLLSQALE
jgi:serine/threonine-protein phosphatase 2A regulatory subunit A